MAVQDLITEIRNETQVGANTKGRIADVLEAIVDEIPTNVAKTDVANTFSEVQTFENEIKLIKSGQDTFLINYKDGFGLCFYDLTNLREYMYFDGDGNVVIPNGNLTLKDSIIIKNENDFTGEISSSILTDDRFLTLPNASGTIALQGQIQLGTAPISASATGVTGTIIYTTDYIYICTAINTWKRVALSTW